MIHKLSRNRSIALVLVFSFMFSLLTPMTARGASLGSAFCPPLGTIGGAIIGYVVGGVLGNYAAGGLSNVATLAGAAVGYAALASSGPVGMVAGVFIGGLLGKVAYKLLKKLDNSVTGGVVFAPEGYMDANGQPSDSVTVSDNKVVELTDSIPVSNNNANTPTITSADISVQEATQKYQEAYQKYVTAARDGANSEDINKAYKEYKEAYENYKKVSAATK